MDVLRRIEAAERRLSLTGRDRLSNLTSVLEGGNFDSANLDAVYGLIRDPLRASVLAASTYWYGGHVVTPSSVPVGRLSMLLAYPHWGPTFRCEFTTEEILDACREVLTLGEEVRHPEILPQFDKGYRARRGLLQRLVQEDGLGSLTQAASQLKRTEEAAWPAPIVNSTTTSLEALVSPIDVALDFPLLLWRDQHGKVRWPPLKP